MKLFGRKVTIIVHHEFYENVEDFMEAVNKLADSKERFQVRMITNRDGQPLYEIIFDQKI